MRYLSIFPLAAVLTFSTAYASDPLAAFMQELQTPTLSAHERLKLAQSIPRHTALSAAMLGNYYYTGEGSNTPDKSRALAMFELSARLGDDISAYSAFLGHVQGWAIQSDPIKAGPYLWQAAKADVSQSRLYLAEGYRTGAYGLPLDILAASQWAYSAEVPPEMHLDLCMQGDPIYMSDRCVNDWVKPAAEQGNPVASYRMGLRSLYGTSIQPPEPKIAQTWLEKAGDYGPALMARGDELFADKGSNAFTEQDQQEMQLLLEKSALAGEPKAVTEWAYVLLEKNERDAALDVLISADIMGSCNGGCQYQLYRLLEKDDPDASRQHLANAVADGDANAIIEYALTLNSKSKDTRELIHQAAVKGNVTAMLWLMDKATEAGDAKEALVWRHEAAAFQDFISQKVLREYYYDNESPIEINEYWLNSFNNDRTFYDVIDLLAKSGRPDARALALEKAKERTKGGKKHFMQLRAIPENSNYYLVHNRLVESLYRHRDRAVALWPWQVDGNAWGAPERVKYGRDVNRTPVPYTDGGLRVSGSWAPPEMLTFKLLANNQSAQQSHCGYLFTRATSDYNFIHKLEAGCRPEPAIMNTLQYAGAKKLVHNGFASAALLHDGSVATWGSAMMGGTPIIAAANLEEDAYQSLDDELKVYRRLQSNIVDIAPVQGHFLALESSGNILLWGPLAYLFDHEIKGDYQALAATPDSDRFCALTKNSEVHCWILGGSATPSVEAKSVSRLVKVDGTFDTFAMLNEAGQLTLQSMVMKQDTDDLLPDRDKTQRWKMLDQVIVEGKLRTLLVDTNNHAYFIKTDKGRLELKSLNRSIFGALIATSPETATYL
ncbi:tetratricopeptide repeat protein [Photobacterium nomapromontoriensis]|uniref:tetratricopeptide repeat protein n=1 Tax=Photobacterium nomapromontoriensis TaxID=2910237 RepID=UPI003D0D4199